jgi:phosphatidylglycerophosphatase A
MSGASLFCRASVVLATGFGLGLSPAAPGTLGSLLGVAIVLFTARLPLPWQLTLAAALALLAVPICHAAEAALGRKDDRRIVADEYLAFPIAMLGLAPTPWVLAMAFVTSRAFDVVKPPPARHAQRMPGGWGIVADDVLANLYSLALNHALYWAGTRLLR